MKTSYKEILEAICQGYPVAIMLDLAVVVENPNYKPDDGTTPNLVYMSGEDEEHLTHG